ncbi:sensor histidine kinase [Streptomyces yaizuensis]|uniref:Oxygen sensor histidine kinase NreB n=1 Tax=Streptomyces yaizuensis TaxID=2989713 RepID=A0ABQ5P3H7_9ACTN|nr:sensor histidine kinase [Streptomyces sp. YSPA8]
MTGDTRGAADRDDRRLDAVMNTAFIALLAGALTRYLTNHWDSPATPWVIGLSATLAVLQLAGQHPAVRARPGAERARFALVVGCWVVVVAMAPSFAWCAVPLIYTGLRSLPTRAAVALVAAVCVLVVIGEYRLSSSFDPILFLLPPVVAVLATAVFVHMRRQADRLRALVDDLIRTRRELAAIERREGTLAERQRLAMEIHDTLAQSLSSQQMLLQAAERLWDGDPDRARGHVRTAESIAERSLAEARRFVHDLAPADLAEGGGLAQALRTLAERETTDTLRIRFHLDGTPVPLPDQVQSALLRIAQGALANVREHAGATSAALTLSHLDDQVVLDIADDGAGFAPAAVPAPGTRGHGLAAMRARLRQLGGALTVESAPGEGTVVSAAVPLERSSDRPDRGLGAAPGRGSGAVPDRGPGAAPGRSQDRRPERDLGGSPESDPGRRPEKDQGESPETARPDHEPGRRRRPQEDR